MFNINELENKLATLNSDPINKIFTHSKYENAYKPDVENSVISLINKNIELNDHAFVGMDICCGHGFMIQSLKREYSNSKLIGIDIDPFNSWVSNVNGLSFYSCDMFELIQLELDFKFDIIFTFNTLRGSIDQWGIDNHHNFLEWCSKHAYYLITNNCTNRTLQGFQIIDTLPVQNDFDTNLFKSISI